MAPYDLDNLKPVPLQDRAQFCRGIKMYHQALSREQWLGKIHRALTFLHQQPEGPARNQPASNPCHRTLELVTAHMEETVASPHRTQLAGCIGQAPDVCFAERDHWEPAGSDLNHSLG